ncbi:ABC-three component system middle component 2 [Cupriavidus oxalaticus]|uniref:Threonine transporter RhtB n=1 Tax=Cupriavidus oxalaticus TaxID=96344 RepID=A0A5P3VRR8_9BURK|nr:ABC-three component system middle component 2 [Cupriavidus oxalaticus]QEZ48695.1 threonine transporter RhtB [Cupriavidus oxalaticus]
MKKSRPIAAFNSPFELGVRMVYLLNSLQPAGADLQKLVLLDYAVVYSDDLGGPPSLHTPVPFRGSEYLSRRDLIAQGLYLMSTRGLVDVSMDKTGITYFAGETARTMVGALTSPYLRELEGRCRWAAKTFASLSSREMTERFAQQGHLWGAEFEGATARRHQWQ